MFHIVRCRLMPFEFGSQALLGLELLFRPETQEAAASLVSFCFGAMARQNIVIHCCEHVQAEMTALLHSV